MYELKTLSKPKGLKGLKGLGQETKLPPLPAPRVQTPQVESLIDQEQARLTLAFGDERLAKKILKLKKKYPDASTLEVAIIEFLDRKRVRYYFQQWLFGGRKIKYGQVVDFLIDKGAYIGVLEAQGNYWHTRKGKAQVDAAQRLQLLGSTFHGKEIKQYVNVWESRIVQPNRALRERTLNAALNGMDLGK